VRTAWFHLLTQESRLAPGRQARDRTLRQGAAPVEEMREVASRGESAAAHLRELKNDLRSLSTHRVTVSYRSAPRAQRASAAA